MMMTTESQNETRPLAISARNLYRTFGSKTAVNGLDLDVYQGEIFAILGPNGAGKTTTVEILEGFGARDFGDVTVLGVDPARANRQWRSRIGVVLQDSNDMGDLTVEEVVKSTAAYYPNPRDPKTVITAVGLDEKKQARLNTLSGGQRRRVDVALGIIGNPDLLFLDEPTTGFDPEARREFWALIASLQDGGTTIVLTTHYMDEAAALADRIGIVIDGQMAALGSTDELTGNHSNLEEAYLSLIAETKISKSDPRHA
jgi:ABC-2 type transport system ATP-binding protein